IDNFKQVNDRFGHERGNDILFAVATTLAQNVRGTDLAARYGGEEFALVLPATSKCGGRLVANRVRAAVARSFAEAHEAPEITVSAGVATFPADARDGRSLIRCADHAMYGAKRSGKNRVELFEQKCRSFKRHEVDLGGRSIGLDGVIETVRIDTLSEGGMTFEAGRTYEPGTTCEATISLPTGDPVDILSRVVTCASRSGGGTRVATMFLYIESPERRRLQHFLISLDERPDG
ncbi:MAG: GGDEF domain-containing protein, partial [Planctomycetota bacterium]|nr:GGDEF domain-containing protein [Planctomycetota bacterium]